MSTTLEIIDDATKLEVDSREKRKKYAFQKQVDRALKIKPPESDWGPSGDYTSRDNRDLVHEPE